MVFSIQYLRGIAAILVLFGHMAYLLNGVYENKNLGNLLFGQLSFGVDLFFLISGFVICLSTEKDEPKKIAKFIIRRIFRVYPLLLICVLVYGLIAHIYRITKFGDPTFYNIIKSMLPLHMDYKASAPFFGYNLLPPAWTLSYEIMFYAIFLISISITQKYRAELSSLIILCSLIVIQILLSGRVSLSSYNKLAYADNIFRPFLAILSSPMLIDFILGMAAYVIFRKVNLRNNLAIKLILLLIISLSIITLFSGVMMPEGALTPSFKNLHGPKRWGALAFVIVTALVMYEKTFGIKFNRLLNSLGDASYSLYLTQWIWFWVLFKTNYFHTIFGFYKFSLAALIIVASSFLTHLFIEKPFILLAKRLTNLCDKSA